MDLTLKFMLYIDMPALCMPEYHTSNLRNISRKHSNRYPFPLKKLGLYHTDIIISSVLSLLLQVLSYLLVLTFNTIYQVSLKSAHQLPIFKKKIMASQPDRQKDRQTRREKGWPFSLDPTEHSKYFGNEFFLCFFLFFLLLFFFYMF